MLDQRYPDAGIHSIDHFALFVPSLDQAEHFYTAFGLTVERANNEIQLKAGDHHRWGRLIGSDHKSMAYLSFLCYEQDLAAIEQQVRAAGGRFDIPDPLKTGEGFWFHDPDGNLIQVKAGERTMPRAKSSFYVRQVGADMRGSHPRSVGKQVRPRRLSHVLLFSPDVPRLQGFYAQAIGLRLSDKSLDIIAFTHAPHGCDHHLVAFAKSSGKGWHHSSWDVGCLDEVGRGAGQMNAAGYKHGWGTGRHVLGSNYFFYVKDPWGSFCEYSADIDYVSEDQPWDAGEFPPEDSLYLWGPDVPPDFIFNTEVAEQGAFEPQHA
jgi:catechol 2,3-dioxygenase